MSVFRGIVAAFAMYSRFPLPRLDFDESTLRYALAAFPLVGAVQGFACVALVACAAVLDVPSALVAALLVVLVIACNGGIHLDGLADTCDALVSHEPRERKLGILKDAHIGAFGVLALLCHLLVQYASYLVLVDAQLRVLLCLPCLFALSRALSALCLLVLPHAREAGMARTFADAAARTASRVVLGLWVLVGVACLFALLASCGRLPAACGIVVAALVALVQYRFVALRQFGGVTGDLAGWFLQNAELYTLAVLAWLGV